MGHFFILKIKSPPLSPTIICYLFFLSFSSQILGGTAHLHLLVSLLSLPTRLILTYIETHLMRSLYVASSASDGLFRLPQGFSGLQDTSWCTPLCTN